MLAKLKKCPKCGKLFAVEKGKRECSTCSERRMDSLQLIEEAVERWSMKEPEDIAAFAGLPVDEVNEIIRQTSFLKRQVDTRQKCKKCRKELAQTGSDYCLVCRMILNQAFGIAAEDMAVKTQEALEHYLAPSVQMGDLNVVSSLNTKRRLTRGSRFAPKNRYSGS